MKEMKRTRFVIFLLIIVSLFISCAVNPVTGKRELMLLSEADEIQLGKQSDAGIVQTYGVYDDPALTQYVNEIGQKMVKISHRPGLKFEFKVMDSPVINAFAVPGGFVYVTRGILAYLNNEAEFAGVLGHEIGHVTARHSAKQYSKAQLTQLGFGLGSALSETFRKYAGIANFGVGMLFLKFSRDNERQSDQLGVEYSTRVGYDANQMANFFETLDRMQPSSGASGLPGWFSTHPNPADRVVAVKKAAKEWQQKTGATNLRIGRNEYLRKVNGIVFGPDPRQGYVENNIFYHPTLKFRFPVPVNWTVNNTPAQVQMVNKKQDAVILFQVSAGTSPVEASNQFLGKTKGTVIEKKFVTVNNFPAQRLLTEIASEQGSVRVLSYFIRKDNNIFVFHGYSAQTTFPQYQPLFETTMKQFKRLTDARKINVKPDRVRVKKVSKAGSLKSILLSFKVPNDKLEKTALLNGMQLTDRVAVNTLIKIIDKGR